MELIQDPIAASVSAREIEPGIADVSFRGTPSSRHGEDRTAEAGSPESGKKTRTSSSKPSDEAFIRHTGPERPSPAGKSDTTTTDGESRGAVPEEPTGNDAQEIESGEGKEKEPSDVQGPSVFSPEGVEVQRLVQTDRRVRSHEHAHIAAGGQYVVSGASFSFQRGPDGKLYAVGGEVSIDTSEISGDPEATIRKMQQIRSAALAPSDPSSQDRAVAARASQIQARARQEALYMKMEEREENLAKESGDVGRNSVAEAGERRSQRETQDGAENRPDLDLYV